MQKDLLEFTNSFSPNKAGISRIFLALVFTSPLLEVECWILILSLQIPAIIILIFFKALDALD